MPNHWRYVLHRRADGDLSKFLRCLTQTQPLRIRGRER